MQTEGDCEVSRMLTLSFLGRRILKQTEADCEGASYCDNGSPIRNPKVDQTELDVDLLIFVAFRRTKLKQTEVDCEVLKRCCETLTEENRRLQKELSELRASQGQSGLQEFLGHMPAATLSMCPSCERLTAIDPVRGSVIINRGNNQYER